MARLIVTATNAVVLPSTIAPEKVKPPLGGTVVWTFVSAGTHDLVDATGMGLFDSGARSIGATYAVSWFAAGKYRYEDAATARSRTVSVPMAASPKSGTISTTFTITWAAGGSPGGLVFDVQIRRPGSATFVSFLKGVTTPSSTFTADAGTGVYRFRARLRSITNGAHSSYSAAASIRVS